MADKKRLTPKMLRALNYYAKDPCKSKADAYRHAYDCSRMKDSTIACRADDLFKHPLVVEALEEINVAAAKATGIDASWVLNRLKILAEFNINKFIVIQGGQAYYDFSKASDDDWYCISEYSRDTITKAQGTDLIETDRVKLKANCKLKALELAGKHVGVGAFQQEQRDVAASTEAVAEALKVVVERLPV